VKNTKKQKITRSQNKQQNFRENSPSQRQSQSEGNKSPWQWQKLYLEQQIEAVKKGYVQW